MKETNTPKQVEEFIKKTFLLYDLSYESFFYEYNSNENETLELPIILNDKLVMPIIEKAAMCLGLSVENFLSMDENAVKCWYNQYPYFKQIKQFYNAYHDSYFNESSKDFLYRKLFFPAQDSYYGNTSYFFLFSLCSIQLFSLNFRYSAYSAPKISQASCSVYWLVSARRLTDRKIPSILPCSNN